MKFKDYFYQNRMSRLLVLFVLICSGNLSAQQTFTTFQAASTVVGQANFTANVAGCTQSGLYAPSYTAISSKGVLAVSEQSGGRVKLWNPTPTANGANASVVVGKTGFTDCSNAGANQASISNSNGVAFSPDGNKLIVTDFGNNRVLIWNTIPTVNGQNADVVLGQANFTTGGGGVSTTAMNGPTGAYVSSDGRLLIADRGNHRILIWNSVPTTNNKPADVVVGQTVFNAPGGGSSATSMVNPWGVCVSPDGKLLVADSSNNRVLVWNTIPTTNGAAADVVIGQTIMGTNGAGTTSTNLNAPIGVTVSPSGKVAIGEFGNSRVVIYNSIPTTNGAAANVVLGQPNFTSLTAFYPSGSATSNNMFSIYNASFDLYGRLYVAGREMNRVLVFGTAPTAQANLGIGITSNISTACIGTNNTITITLTNATATAATGVIATASLPAGFTYSSHTASGGTYSPTSAYWNLGTVPASGTRTLTINGVANASGNLTAYASIVQSNQLDPVLSNNGAGVSYTIVGAVPPPTGDSNQTFCNAATISSLSATGTSIQWYANATLGSPLATSTPLANGVMYYASQTLGPCESTTRLTVTVTIQPLTTYYEDADGDGFGNSTATTMSCTPVSGYVLNNSDCNDAQLQYADLDGDGFGSTTLVACGVTNNSDTNDNLLTYSDTDGDGFGSTTFAPSGVTNNSDCNDSQATYADADSDGFGAGVAIPCGAVTNNTDCNDANPAINTTFAFYIDADADGFGFGTALQLCAINGTTPPAGYSANNLDCNDAQVRYQDLDGDLFGSTIKVPCGGRPTSTDCNDNLLTYRDLDGDGYGVNVLVPCGVPNRTDCNDNSALVYQSNALFVDADGDGYTTGQTITVCYGATVPAGFALTNIGIDCDDNFAAINPGTNEVPYNGIDDDCDSLIDEGFPQITTALLPGHCDTTLASIGSLVGVTTLPSGSMITGYRIRVTNGSEVQIIDRGLANFTMQMFASYAYATTYTVDIELQRNGVWLGYYGPTCQISTPAILAEGGAAAVSASQCGITLPRINTLIATTSLQGVTGYRFRVTNLTDQFGPNSVQAVTRPLNWFSLQMLTRYNYGTTYRIEVAVKTTGDFGGYGSPCEVSSPPSPALTNCNATIATSTTLIASTSLAGVTQYRFQVTRQSDNASATLDRSSNYFTFNNLPAAIVSPGVLYTVRVAVMTSGQWSPLGDACEITSPGTASRPADAVVANPSAQFKATATPNPFASEFTIDISTPSQEPVTLKVYDMLGRLMESRTIKVSELSNERLGAKYPSGVYNVIVDQAGAVKTLRMIKR